MSDPIQESPFLTEVRSAFGELLQRGDLTLRSSVYDEEAFGNSAVVLAGQNFQVRLLWDRGDTFADARSSASPEWRPLERVLRAVGVAGAPPEGLLSVGQAAKLIQRHLFALEAGFAPGSSAETERVLRTLDADALKQAEDRWSTGRKNED